AARSGHERPAGGNDRARAFDNEVALVLAEKSSLAVGSKDDKAGQRTLDPARKRGPQPPQIEPVLIVERRRQRRQYSTQRHRSIVRREKRLSRRHRSPARSVRNASDSPSRFRPRTSRNMATAGLSNHGKSASARTLDASASIVPQLATESG